MDLPRSWEVAGTREIPAWELELLARWGEIVIPSDPRVPPPPPITFPKDDDGSGS